MESLYPEVSTAPEVLTLEELRARRAAMPSEVLALRDYWLDAEIYG
jgi:hypothetical protein